MTFTAEATGMGPLNYYWEWKPAEEEGESKTWQQCCAEWSDGVTLTIPSVQKCNEGSYRCVISNYAGSQTSNPADRELSVGENPTIIICLKLQWYIHIYIHTHIYRMPYVGMAPKKKWRPHLKCANDTLEMSM